MEKLKQFRQFLVDVWSELKKTTWPRRQEVYGTTLVVIITVVICATYLWLVDLVLNKSMAAIFKAFGQ